MLAKVCGQLDEHYESITIRGERFWRTESGQVFRPCELDGEYALVTEIADSIEAAEMLWIEDSDIYRLEDYLSADRILAEIMDEVSQ